MNTHQIAFQGRHIDLNRDCTFADLRDINKKPRFFKSISHFLQNLSHKLDFSREMGTTNSSKWHITLIENHIKIQMKSIQLPHFPSITRAVAYYVYNFIKHSAFFIPRKILGMLAYSLDSSYIKARNRHIIKNMIKNMEKRKLAYECLPQNHLLKPRLFKENPKNKESSKFESLPKDIQLLNLSFLNKKDNCQFAYTCKQNHLLAFENSLKPANQLREYPNFILSAFGKTKLLNLPFLQFPKGSLWPFSEWFVALEQRDDDEGSHINARSKFAFEQLQQSDRRHRNWQQPPFECMGNHSLCKIQLPAGPALMVRLKDNILNQECALLIANNHGKWTILTSVILSKGMFFFLNDIHFEEAPLVLDYLQRLIKGEPCGKFPSNLNRNLVRDLDYPRDRFSPVLREGPVFCEDGITPVLELWKPA